MPWRKKGQFTLVFLPGKSQGQTSLAGHSPWGLKVRHDAAVVQECWNTFGIPTLVVEHNRDRWYDEHAAEALQWGTECYGNFLIQTALAKLKIIEKK